MAPILLIFAAIPFFQKGVNFTAESGYAPAIAIPTLDALPSQGINAIALVPYGFERKGSTEIAFGSRNTLEREEDILALTGLAHRRGIKVLLKPQIWLRGGFPGDLDFASASGRAQWFRSYEAFILHYADLATRSRADLFAIGTEFVHLSPYEADWRRIIAKVRARYKGPLVYAANCGPDFEQTRFWDALDYIGLNEYYPLPDSLATGQLIARVEQVQRRYHKPVILTEVGFASLRAPQEAPWDESDRELALEEQARCYQAVFKAFYSKPWFYGMYWWKVGNNGYGGPQDKSFTPWRKPAMDVVQRWYLHGGR